MIASLLVVITALLAPPNPKARLEDNKSPAFPTEFRGDWYGAHGRCKVENLALQIGAVELDYADEFSGRLTRIVRQTERSVKYSAEYSAEGHVWNATETLRLSSDGRMMTLEPERTSSRYYRCKKVSRIRR